MIGTEPCKEYSCIFAAYRNIVSTLCNVMRINFSQCLLSSQITRKAESFVMMFWDEGCSKVVLDDGIQGHRIYSR